MTVRNLTITGGVASGNGGGIFSSGSTTLVYATIARNSAANVGNLVTATLESFASVVAGQAGGANCFAENTASHGYNFSDDDTCGFSDHTDRQDAGDPQLGPLADNGGPTRTSVVDITADQRGVTRPQGPGCDVGAVEVEVLIPPVQPVPPTAPAPVPPAPAPVAAVPRFTG
jgi:hypothetical protein